MRLYSFGLIAVVLAGFVPGNASPAVKAGKLEFRFLYLPPGTADPTYHTAIWLEDEDGKLIRTLYVSNELSATEHKLGTVCPDWVKQAGWSKAPKSLVDAVTGPTPNVGSGSMTFDLGELGIAPGTYRVRFQVHIIDQYNILFQGKLAAGNSEQDVKIETLYQPTKPDIGTDVVKEVRIHYLPAPPEQ